MVHPRVLSLHLAIALAAGAAGWWASSSRGAAHHAAVMPGERNLGPGPGSGGREPRDSPRRFSDRVAGTKAAVARPWWVPAPALIDGNAIQSNADGSFRVPKSMLDRMPLSLLFGDDDLNAGELRSLGFSTQEIETLAGAVDEAREEARQREAALARKSPGKGEDEILIIPARAADRAAGAELDRIVKEVAGERYPVVGPGLREAMKAYLGDVPLRMVSHRKHKLGHVYHEVQLKEGRMGELGPEPAVEDFHTISTGSSSTIDSTDPQKRYSHLFPGAR